MRKTTNTNGAATRVSGKMINILLNLSCAEVFLAVYGILFYEGFDLSHSRRIGNFDVSGGIEALH